MARVTPLEPDDFTPELRDFLGEAAVAQKEKLGVARIWAQRPDLYIPYKQFMATAMARSLLPRRLIELLRLRIAFHNQCRSCMAIRYNPAVQDGITEDLVCQLQNPEEGEDLSDKERAALHYADLLAANHMAINDNTFDYLREHFTEAEIIDIGMHCAYCIGFGRLAMSWDMVDDLPERFKLRDETITPWGADAMVV